LNYIKEINAFYVKIETNPLTASATALWYTLLHINNRTGWLEEFTVAAAVICNKAGLPLSTFKRARNELQDKGYVTYTSRGTLAPVYRMISLVRETGDGLVDVGEREGAKPVEEKVCEKQEVVENPVEPPVSTEFTDIKAWGENALQAIDKMEQNSNEEQPVLSQSTLQFYTEHFGVLSKYARKDLQQYAQALSDAHVLQALKRAVESGNQSFQYVRGILKNWKRNKLYTMEDVLRAEREFRQRRDHGHAYKRHGFQEIIPDWFEESRRQRHKVG
jgi:DnaD/phage-associated family protein